jgi:hypothetical protein
MWIMDACNVSVVWTYGLYAGVQSRLGSRPYGVCGKRGKCGRRGLLVESWVDSRGIGAGLREQWSTDYVDYGCV